MIGYFFLSADIPGSLGCSLSGLLPIRHIAMLLLPDRALFPESLHSFLIPGSDMNKES
jgi:hypothetical protein